MDKVKTSRLRSCTAKIHEVTFDGNEKPFVWFLQSYNSIVADVEKCRGENGKIWWEISLHPLADCSTTTMSHVRKFVEDVCGMSMGFVEMRENARENIGTFNRGNWVPMKRFPNVYVTPITAKQSDFMRKMLDKTGARF